MTSGQLRRKPRTRAVAPADKTERRAEILRAAEALLHADPGGGIAVEDLARRAGLAKGTVYLYFRTREEVLLQVHLERLQGLFDLLESALAATEVDATYRAVRATLRYVRAHPEFLPLAINCRSMLESNASAGALLQAPSFTPSGMCSCWQARFPWRNTQNSNRLPNFSPTRRKWSSSPPHE